MVKESFMKRRTNVFIHGITILVLIIIAGIFTGFIVLPLYGLAYYINDGRLFAFMGVMAFIISIYMLGWTFMRFKVNKK